MSDHYDDDREIDRLHDQLVAECRDLEKRLRLSPLARIENCHNGFLRTYKEELVTGKAVKHIGFGGEANYRCGHPSDIRVFALVGPKRIAAVDCAACAEVEEASQDKVERGYQEQIDEERLAASLVREKDE